MMKRVLLLICIVFFAGNSLFAQGILFENGSWEEALTKAKTENRFLFVDVYTSWCGPCKRMARDVFTQDKVGEYFNRNFISYKMDAEQGVGPKIKERYGVKAYPTFLFLDGDGKLIYKLVGFHDVRAFLSEVEKVYLYAKYGGWEKVTENYASGEGGSDFWKDCYDRANDDEVQDVLRKYLLSMSDEELFKIENGILVRTVDYDFELYARVAKGLLSLQKSNDLEFSVAYTYVFEDKIGRFLYEAIEKSDEKWFNELMALKRDLDQLPDSEFSDINVTGGRSFLKVSGEFLRLCFYRKSMNGDEAFRKLVVEYMDKMMKSIPLKKILEERKERQKPQLMSASDSLLMSMLPDDVKKQMVDPVLQKKAEAWEYRMMGNTIVDWTNYYWQVAPSDKMVRERCVNWLNYACGMNPANPEAPVNAAPLLVRLKCKKNALRHLKLALAQQRKLGYDDIRQLRQLKLTFRNVKDGKL